jgi:hypothetical protein
MQQHAGPSFLFALQMNATDVGQPVALPTGMVMSAATSRDGAWLVVERRTGLKTQLFRYPTDRIEGDGELLGTVPAATSTTLRAVSGDGRVALIEAVQLRETGKGETPQGLGTFIVIRPGQEAQELMAFRLNWQGALDDDGKRALASGSPVSCALSDIRACPVELWLFDWTSGPLRSTRLGAEAHASYYPAFVPGSADVLFQTTYDDANTDCQKHLNRCPHEIVRVEPRDFRAIVVEQRAIGPTPSNDGRSIAMLKYPETCEEVPCPSYDMRITTRGSSPVTIGRGEIVFGTSWSPDSDWFAWAHRSDGRTRMFVAQPAHPSPQDLGQGWVVGWLR